MIQIIGLNREGLKSYISSERFEALPFWPITPHRAISHIKNPRADAADDLLLLAYEDKILVGYLGVLADWIYLKNGKKSKCGWLSCMWINPDFRGKGISYKLVNAALKKWDQKILVTEFTAPAKGLYDKIGVFEDLTVKSGIRLYRRLDLEKILPPKKTLFKKTKILWHFIDLIGNGVLDVRFLFQHRKLGSLKIEYLERPDDQINEFILRVSNRPLFQRNKDDLSWIMQYPWILNSRENSGSFEKYYFSSVAMDFAFYAAKIFNASDRLIGFLMFSKRDHTLKIPYAYFELANLKDIVRVINYLLKQWRIKTLSTFNRDLVEYYRNVRSGFLFKKGINRHYIISNTLYPDLPDSFEIQDGDGDAAFT